MVESGPAAGVVGAARLGAVAGYDHVITFDMGGTTAKACLIQNHEPLVTGTFEVDRRYRFKPGSGMPISVPSIDMIEIGAGGGSIAWIDDLGLLKTGPHSAGSMPGPICYGRGGDKPCVTDADVALGIIDPDRFLGGDMKLDGEAAVEALGALGARLGLDARKTAWGVFEVVCEQMAAAARSHATERAVDYRGLPMLAFGGAGPVHACMVAELLDSRQVIYPPLASVLSAFGTLVTPAQIDLARSSVALLDAADWNTVGRLIDDMKADGAQALTEAGIAPADVRYRFSVDMRYLGQQSELRIDLPDDPRKMADPSAIRALFEQEYVAQYGLKLDDMAIELVNWRVAASGPSPDRRPSGKAGAGSDAARGHRTVYIRGEATRVPVRPPTAEQRARMEALAYEARMGYRGVVYDHPRFVDYFRMVTPVAELGLLNIGSRPARRPKGSSGVESLRAIPWQFAWTQTRLLLASWLGVEVAIGDALQRGEGDELRRMYREWPFFRSTLDLIEMVLAKADARIAERYDRELVEPDLQALGDDLRGRLSRAINAVLAVTQHGELVADNPVLRRSINVRNPYVDPINLVQVELLRRLRSGGPDEVLERALLVTMNGIAAGLRNTG